MADPLEDLFTPEPGPPWPPQALKPVPRGAGQSSPKSAPKWGPKTLIRVLELTPHVGRAWGRVPHVGTDLGSAQVSPGLLGVDLGGFGLAG